jgi:hypothetical protein
MKEIATELNYQRMAEEVHFLLTPYEYGNL